MKFIFVYVGPNLYLPLPSCPGYACSSATHGPMYKFVNIKTYTDMLCTWTAKAKEIATKSNTAGRYRRAPILR